MAAQFHLGEITVDVTLKEIKNIHLSVHPPTGAVRISAPSRRSLETIRVYAVSRLPWIRQQQRKFQAQERETPREYLERESHYVWGRRYLLTILEEPAEPSVELGHQRLTMRVRPGTGTEQREALLSHWYREQLKAAVPELVARWEPVLRVQVERFYVRRMRTRWGSCNPRRGTIRLNTELVKKPSECLEYITVHEMMHLLEPTHNARFVGLMDHHLPGWRHTREILNRLPVRHEVWLY